MIRRDRAAGTLVGEDLRPDEIAELDERLERVSPDRLEWRDPAAPSRRVRGLGDVVERIAKPIAKVLGIKRCGCAERRERLNELFPSSSVTAHGESPHRRDP